jgi:hypothetical protein
MIQPSKEGWNSTFVIKIFTSNYFIEVDPLIQIEEKDERQNGKRDIIP